MAEESSASSWRAGCLGCSGLVLVFFAIVWVAIAIDQRDFDPRDICDPGESGECITSETGVVASDDIPFEDVRVAYDDGRKTADIFVDDQEEPAPGSRVILEWWDGDVVALVERDTGRRYRTEDWPSPWWEWLAVWGVLALAAGVALGSVFGVVAGVNRLGRRRQAATSNGKPWRSRSRSKSRR